MNDRPFFGEEYIEVLLRKLKDGLYNDRIERNNLILDLIRVKNPISKYELHTLSGLSYPTIKQITKEFEFVGLIRIKHSWGDNNMPVQLVYVNEVKDEKDTY